MELILEISAVLLNICFLILLINERRSCWFFGIAASILSVILFYFQNLYSESILYGFYVMIGIYGWLVWDTKSSDFLIQRIRTGIHIAFLVLGAIATYVLGSFMEQRGGDRVFADAFSTIFGVIASFLEIYKVLSAWIYWIVLNAFSIWLYLVKDLEIYAGLMLLYLVLSVYGLANWRKKFMIQAKNQ